MNLLDFLSAGREASSKSTERGTGARGIFVIPVSTAQRFSPLIFPIRGAYHYSILSLTGRLLITG